MKLPTRYNTLLSLIKKCKPTSVCEVGTWNGNKAVAIGNSLENKIHYIGYDLFEEATIDTDTEEFNVKPHYTVEQVQEYIYTNITNLNFTFELVKGNTKRTLREYSVDIAFIDGGHSVETISNDYEKLKESKIIIFDDYYLNNATYSFNLEKLGCNSILENLQKNFYLFPDRDPVKGGGEVTMAVLFNENSLESICKKDSSLNLELVKENLKA